MHAYPEIRTTEMRYIVVEMTPAQAQLLVDRGSHLLRMIDDPLDRTPSENVLVDLSVALSTALRSQA